MTGLFLDIFCTEWRLYGVLNLGPASELHPGYVKQNFLHYLTIMIVFSNHHHGR